MSNEIQLISDGDGLAVLGDPSAVESFLRDEGLSSKELGLQRLGPALGVGAAAIQAGSEIAANSGRWVKMTKESAALAKKYGLMKNSKTGFDMGVVQVKGPAGIKGILQFEKAGFLTNPAFLAGAAGIMAQLAMQQAMNEITDYLAVIDVKVDDVLRAQKDAVLADMIGVGFVIEEAMTIRDQVDRVSEVTWSKVQGTPQTIGRTRPMRWPDSTHSRRGWNARPGLAISPRQPTTQSPRWGSGSLSWLAASSCRTRSACWN